MTRSIHMEIEQVEVCITTLRNLHQAMQTALDRAVSAQSSLVWAWESPGSQEFLEHLGWVLRRLQVLLADFSDLIGKLEHERDEWISAAQHLGDGLGLTFGVRVGSGDTMTSGLVPLPWQNWEDFMNYICGTDQECRRLWSKPPDNASDLALMIHYLPSDLPIALMPLGKGEYLLLLKGTDLGGFSKGHNAGSAVESNFTHNSSYQLSVLSFLSMLPPGSVLHIAGHSQGGMVAQNLAVDPRLKARGIQVKSVITFGSPDTLQGANPDTTYIMFQQQLDPVGYIDEGIERGIAMLISSRMGMSSVLSSEIAKIFAAPFSDIERQAEVHFLRSSKEPGNLHSYHIPEIRAQLENYGVPFNGSEEAWSQGLILGQTQIQTLAAKGWQEIMSAPDIVVQEIDEGFAEIKREIQEGLREIRQASPLQKPVEVVEMSVEIAREELEASLEIEGSLVRGSIQMLSGAAKFAVGLSKAVREGISQRLFGQ